MNFYFQEPEVVPDEEEDEASAFLKDWERLKEANELAEVTELMEFLSLAMEEEDAESMEL